MLAQSALLPGASSRAALRWIALPLAADPILKVRLTFARCSRGLATLCEHHYAALPPDEDDASEDGEAHLLPASDEAVRAEVASFRPSREADERGEQAVDAALLQRAARFGEGGGGGGGGFGSAFEPPTQTRVCENS